MGNEIVIVNPYHPNVFVRFSTIINSRALCTEVNPSIKII